MGTRRTLKMPSKEQLEMTMADIGIGEMQRLKLERLGIFTVGDLKRMGLSGLARSGVYGDSLMRILSGLESNGIECHVLFLEKDELDIYRMRMMNMPLTRFFDNSFVLETFCMNSITRVKHMISIPRFVLAKMFFQRGTDGNAAADSILARLENAGIRMDADTRTIRFHKSRIKHLAPETADDMPIHELGLTLKTKRALMRNGIFSIGHLKAIDEIEGLPKMGVWTSAEVKAVVDEFLANEEKNYQDGREM